MYAGLNGLKILAGDIQNAYLNAPTAEKNYFIAGPEWGSAEGRVVLITRALYGLRSSAFEWRMHISNALKEELGFDNSLADPQVWRKPMSKADGSKYYAYILVYVDDLLIIDVNPKQFMDQIEAIFKVKPGSIEVPNRYLGTDIGKIMYPDGSKSWTMGSKAYVVEAIKNVKKRLAEDNLIFNKKLSDPNISVKQPFSCTSYRPEIDTSALCNTTQTQFYQNLIGVLRWIVELGRIDIGYEVSVLSSFMCNPRTGHLQQALHIFKYLDIHSNNVIAFDPAYLDIPNPTDYPHEKRIHEMKVLYPDSEEVVPPNAPEPRGLPVQINCFVDSDHAGDLITRRSHTGIIMYCNLAPINWYSKRQTTVETSTFGSEFVALKTATEMIVSLRYKLRMFGIPIAGPANVFCDNEAVYKNTSNAQSQLKKKSQQICYHYCRSATAAGVTLVHKEDSETNLSDILTKSVSAPKRKALRERIMVNTMCT